MVVLVVRSRTGHKVRAERRQNTQEARDSEKAIEWEEGYRAAFS